MDDNLRDRLSKIRQSINNARREVNSGRPLRARELIRSAYQNSDDLGGTVEWADLAVTMAETFLAELRPEAETYFKEALGRLDQVDCLSELKMRANEGYAHFLFSVAKRPVSARPFCEAAKTVAVNYGSAEDIARVQLRLLSIDLKADNHPQYDDFQTLMRVGNEGEFTSQEILTGWTVHVGRSQDSAQRLRYARKSTTAADAYFQKLLTEIRNSAASEQLLS